MVFDAVSLVEIQALVEYACPLGSVEVFTVAHSCPEDHIITRIRIWCISVYIVDGIDYLV